MKVIVNLLLISDTSQLITPNCYFRLLLDQPQY